jgi:O-antigen/teichoic acid export membrane protein
MLFARAFTLASGGALIVYAARTFSVSEYGRYSVAVAMMAIFGLLSEMGISGLALREMSPDDARRAQILGVALAAEIVTSIAAAALLVPAGLALGYSSAVLVLLAIAGASFLFQGLLPPIDATFKAHRVLSYAAALTVVQSAITAAFGFALVALGAGPAGLMTALLLGAFAAVPVAFVLLKRNLGIVPSFDGARKLVLPFLLAAAPIGFTGAITAIYERVDVVMVSKLDSAAAAAIYSIPLTIVQYSLVVPAIIGTAFFPLFANNLRADPASARASFFLVSRLFLFASVPIALVLAVGGGDIVTFLFGDRYHGSGGVLLLLGWNVILGFQIFLLWYGLLAAHRERGMAALMAAGLALNVGLNFVLIPAYGPRGAAAALIASDGFVVVTQAALLHRTVFELPFTHVLAKPLLAGVLAVAVVLALRSYSGLLAGMVAALLFVSVLLASRYITRTEWEPLTKPFTRLLARG